MMLVAAFSPPGSAQPVKLAGFFLDGTKNPALLVAIRRAASPEVAFNRHFSSAFVSCGVGCGSYWFVDRRTGGVVQAPEALTQDVAIWDVQAQATSDTIAVT